MSLRTLSLSLAALLSSTAAAAQAPSADEAAFRATYKELVETNTTLSAGSCTLAADRMAARLRAAGFPAGDLHLIVAPGHPKEGSLVAVLPGRDPAAKAILLLAHIDVVEANRADWERDPFTLVEENGFFFARGSSDDKAQAAVWVDTLARMKREGYRPKRTIKMALTCGEETAGAFNGAEYLAANQRPLIDAEFALNEGGWIMKGADGRVRYVSISTADKISIPMTVTARGTSTHSSMPRPDNAIFALSRALAKLSTYETPLTLTPATRQFFTALARTSAPPMSDYFRDLVGPDSARARRADAVIGKDPLLHALVRNTIAPVIIQGGFRANVIPGSAQATVNLRMIPGSDLGAFVAELRRVVGDSTIEMKATARSSAGTEPSSEDTELYRALVRSARTQFPDAEVTPYLFQAGTDAAAWRSRGVPVYGIYPYPIDADELTRMHGNDEKVSIASLKEGTEMIYRVLVDVAGKRR